jgi:hypothetical protein
MFCCCSSVLPACDLAFWACSGTFHSLNASVVADTANSCGTAGVGVEGRYTYPYPRARAPADPNAGSYMNQVVERGSTGRDARSANLSAAMSAERAATRSLIPLAPRADWPFPSRTGESTRELVPTQVEAEFALIKRRRRGPPPHCGTGRCSVRPESRLMGRPGCEVSWTIREQYTHMFSDCQGGGGAFSC